jgi:AraC-like DNA-binding protein
MFELLYLGSIFFALLTIYLLLFSKNALHTFSNYIFSFILMLEVFFIISYLLIFLGTINHVPHLFKVSAPFNYLIAPLAYLYVRSILLDKNKFSLAELLHFVPFLLVLINYTPFYFLPTYEKSIIVQKVSEDIIFGLKFQAGYVKEAYLFYLKVIQTLIYLILQWSLIFKFTKTNKNQKIQSQLFIVIKWVKVFTLVFTGILMGFIFLSLLFSLEPKDDIFQAVTIAQGFLLSTSFFILSVFILVNPKILIGLPFVKHDLYRSGLSKENESRPFFLDNYEKEILDIETYMKSTKAYLNPKISLALVSVETNISTKELSYIINSYYNVRFTDFINKYRIEYFIQMLEEGNLESYTIEGLIKNCGFSSKSSFHSAFKRIHNCTPSQYISTQKAGSTA